MSQKCLEGDGLSFFEQMLLSTLESKSIELQIWSQHPNRFLAEACWASRRDSTLKSIITGLQANYYHNNTMSIERELVQ
jgi:hypothetical protein